MGKDSFGKDSLGKDSFGKDSFGKDNLGKDSLGQDNSGHGNLGKDNHNGKDKDKDKDEATGFETVAISARCAMTFSGRLFVSTLAANLTGIWADFRAGDASIGRVDGTVDGVFIGVDDRTVAGGAKSSTTPITMDGL